MNGLGKCQSPPFFLSDSSDDSSELMASASGNILGVVILVLEAWSQLLFEEPTKSSLTLNSSIAVPAAVAEAADDNDGDNEPDAGCAVDAEPIGKGAGEIDWLLACISSLRNSKHGVARVRDGDFGALLNDVRLRVEEGKFVSRVSDFLKVL